MRKLSSLITGAALTLTVGALGCIPDVGDPFDSLTTIGNDSTTGDGDGDQTGDGDGDQTGDGDGDPTTGDGDGDPTTGDGDGDPACGAFGESCSGDTCCDGLGCGADGTCGLGGGDGDGDPTGGDGDAYDPMTCAEPSIPVMVGALPGSFCSAPCTSDLDCPAGPAGTNAACALIADGGMDPTNCALVCQPAMDGCPAGSTCKDLMDPNNPGIGLCTYP